MAGKDIKLDERFLQPVESMARAMEMAEVPLLVMRASDHAAFVDQVVAMLGGTVIYTSQSDFVAQMLASMKSFDHLFALIDTPLTQKTYDLVRAYLAARDIMGADNSQLAAGFNAPPPDAKHRLILVVDRSVFDRHAESEKRALAEFCTVIAVS
jgi:hypothetical protein